ncbi:MAG: hypothetical protein M5U12_29520 [Verrucomicrobia bacterium]|nr:hypothetical protein [Verrucomicrobiota bacterium]
MNATLAPGASLGRIAEIVRNAVRLGPDAWADAPGGRRGESGDTRPRLLPTDSDVIEPFTLLARRKLPYLLVGGVAMLRYVAGRNTEHIDLLMSLASLRQLPELTLEEHTEFFVRARFRSVRADVLLTSNPLFAEVQRDFGTTHRFAELDIPTATPEGLVLLKLYALPSLYRQGDFDRVAVYEADVASLLHRFRCPTPVLLARLEAHLLASDVRELRGVVRDLEARIARFEQFPPS